MTTRVPPSGGQTNALDFTRRDILRFGALLAVVGPVMAACTSSSKSRTSSSASAGASAAGSASASASASASGSAVNTASFKGITLNVACNPTSIEPAKAAAKIWGAKYGATVNAQVIPYAERATDFATMIVSKDPHYDVLFASVDFVSNFGARLYDDLGDLGGLTADLVPAALGQLTNGGKLYGAPLFADMELFIYNKQDWRDAGLDPEKIPTTWDELYGFATKLNVNGRDANATPWNIGGVPFWLSLYNSLGGKLFNDDKTQLLFNNDQALQVWQSVEKGFQSKFFGLAGANAPGGDTDVQVLFNQHKASSEINTVGFWAEAVSNDPQFQSKVKAEDVGVAVMPGIDAGKSGSVIVAEGFGINKFGQHKDAALDFIKFASGPDFQKQVVLGQAGPILPPASISVSKDPEVIKAFPIAPLLVEQAKSQLTWPGNAPYAWNAPFLLGLTNLSKGIWTAQQAHDATVKAVQQLIVQYIAA